MIEIHENYSLKNKNSFKIDVNSDYFAIPKSALQIQGLIAQKKFKNIPTLILGGGCNILFTDNFKGLIINPQIKGLGVEDKTHEHVIVKAGAGENWDSFVEWTVKHGYGGIENLSLIPGTVGASPVQDIGAYGVEVKNVIIKVNAIELDTGKFRVFNNEECKFIYRGSIFKNELKGKYIITDVYFKLRKKPTFITNYGNIGQELSKFDKIDLKTVRQAVINIRETKLPDPENIPNAGSFFKNPVVSKQKYDELLKQFPDLVSYPIEKNQVKLAAGWLIDYCAWKGKSIGQAGVHKKQALVLVNNGNANGKEILFLAEEIRKSVAQEFVVDLDFEVNIY